MVARRPRQLVERSIAATTPTATASAMSRTRSRTPWTRSCARNPLVQALSLHAGAPGARGGRADVPAVPAAAGARRRAPAHVVRELEAPDDRDSRRLQALRPARCARRRVADASARRGHAAARRQRRGQVDAAPLPAGHHRLRRTDSRRRSRSAARRSAPSAR